MWSILQTQRTNPVADDSHAMTADAIREALEAPGHPADEVLRAATQHAAALVPAVVAAIHRAAQGVYLLPAQSRLLFHGLHALAAAGRTELYAPLMELLRRPPAEVDQIFGDAVTETLAQLVLAVFDGDAEPIVEAIADESLDPMLRWCLLEVLARLSFDGAVPRERVVAVIDRLAGRGHADDDDLVWQGAREVVALLALEERAAMVRAAWDRAGEPADDPERRDWEADLRAAVARPGDDERFMRRRLMPLDDAAEALRWTAAMPDDDAVDSEDPAAAYALTLDELDWLAGFLASANASDAAMSLEMLDGFFAALAVGPESVPPGEFMPVIWGEPDGDGPRFADAAQAEFVDGLLTRHRATIAARLAAGYPHVPCIDPDDTRSLGAEWAYGFDLGIGLREAAWLEILDEPRGQRLADAILLLDDSRPQPPLAPRTAEARERWVAKIPETLAAFHALWRDQAVRRPVTVPVRSAPKIGRNDRCPCGSGRKYKHCCGGAYPPVGH